MRVISGAAKGKRLNAPKGKHTRPVTGMIKEALFSSWGSDFTGSSLLDLFAGSGSVGIEALSRGAGEVVFVDNDAEAIRVIKNNLNECGFFTGFEIFKDDVFRIIDYLSRKSRQFDFIYIDPPFTNTAIFDEIMPVVNQARILKDDGVLVIRTRTGMRIPEKLGLLQAYRIKKYGDSILNYYKTGKEVEKIDGDFQDT